MAAADGSAHVGGGGRLRSLRATDVSKPWAPVEAGFFDTPDTVYGVAVAGSYVDVADETEGLRMIDVSSPSAPGEVGCSEIPWGDSVAVSEGLPFATGRWAGLYVFDDCRPFFSDGFEAGDTSAWSATAPQASGRPPCGVAQPRTLGSALTRGAGDRLAIVGC